MTINDIARMAGVSKGTVSRVINNSKDGVSDETRQRILSIIEETGYVPNRMAGSISSSKTKTLGLIIPDIQNAFFPQMVRGAEDCATEHGYTLFLCNSDSNIRKQEQYLRAFLEKRVDGFLVNTCGDIEDAALYNAMIKSGIPFVLLDRKTKTFPNVPGVYIDNRRASYEGVNYLINSGCKKIAMLCGPYGIFTTTERFRGYRDSLEDNHLEFNEQYITYGDYSVKFGYEATKKMMSDHPEIDAIFASSDVTAIGVLKALHEMRIDIPEQVSVLGFDNITFSEELSPALTTVAQPIYDLGYHAMDKLISMIDRGCNNVKDDYLDTVLIVRQSTKNR